MQLGIILTSLEDNSHVASLLGFTHTAEAAAIDKQRALHSDTHLAQVLMKTVLRNLGFHTVSPQHHLVVTDCTFLISSAISI